MTDEEFLADVARRHIDYSMRFGCWHRTLTRRIGAEAFTTTWMLYVPGTVCPERETPAPLNGRLAHNPFQVHHRHGHGGWAWRREVEPACDDEAVIRELVARAKRAGRAVLIPLDLAKPNVKLTTDRKRRACYPPARDEQGGRRRGESS